jgi:tetratricopeptide (TPR) repeat protein
MTRTGWPMAVIAVVLALGIVATQTPAPESVASDEKIGKVSFPVSCAPAVGKPFERAVALLHSFWYLEAQKAFTAVAQTDPGCAMAHWGAAMSLWYQIWSPPRPQALAQGLAAVEKARAIGGKTPRERDFIAAAEAFFRDHDKLDHPTRALAYEKAMEQAYGRHAGDSEVALFYALALQATADPKDKTYAKQKKSGEIAAKIFAAEPDHPGAAHYVIHAYDYPHIASHGKVAADRYARFAPTVPHALHMPSHIYVLLGMWPETIEGNLAAAEAERARGNPDDHMHVLDYLVYAYLQRGQDGDALRVLDEGRRIVADMAARRYDSGRATAPFAISAMEARYVVERARWGEAAALEPRTSKFPHADAHVVFARAIGAARSGNPAPARADAEKLGALRDALTQAKNGYWAEQVEIQRRAATAWVARAEGRNDEALTLMRSAVELEGSTEKHNITPGPIATARELLGDLLLELKQPGPAVREYEASLQAAPNRFRAFYGAARAAELAGDREKAKAYYTKLLAVTAPNADRPETRNAKAFLAR